MSRRAFVVVLDAVGAGALPDAADYGDAGTNTLLHLAQEVGGLDLPALEHLGLGCVLDLPGVTPSPAPVLHGRLHALGPGKDSITGHWELMGVVAQAPPPTYPEGFPPEVIAVLEQATGRRFCCNRPYDGMRAIEDFGARHLETGELILYTSQDSVLQIAAHVDRVADAELQELCAAARAALPASHAVGRVIARPFAGAPGAFERTPGRRDFALAPPHRSYLDALRDAGVPVHAVGKVGDLFAGAGIDHRHPGADNAQALASTEALVRGLDGGLVFTNLIETDQVYGHRKDVDGFHRALQEIDAAVARWLGLLGEEDLLVLSADHGVDPRAPHSDHTREHAPLLARFPGHGGRRHDGPMADVGASVLKWLADTEDAELPGLPFTE
ncbi:MAG TPA: phosphopentomutase [Solirubrobacteraceae bacterium]|nr:phosphopentomutase [Solirubrobacteraceae bacterium]